MIYRANKGLILFIKIILTNSSIAEVIFKLSSVMACFISFLTIIYPLLIIVVSLTFTFCFSIRLFLCNAPSALTTIGQSQKSKR